MKRALIIFAFVFLITLLVPLISLVQSEKSDNASKSSELVTIFDSQINLVQNYH